MKTASDKLSETIHRDLREELGFLKVFDRAMKAVMEIIDLPDQGTSLLIRLILQNRGGLSKNKRTGEFPELADDEIVRIEAAINELENIE